MIPLNDHRWKKVYLKKGGSNIKTTVWSDNIQLKMTQYTIYIYMTKTKAQSVQTKRGVKYEMHNVSFNHLCIDRALHQLEDFQFQRASMYQPGRGHGTTWNDPMKSSVNNDNIKRIMG